MTDGLLAGVRRAAAERPDAVALVDPAGGAPVRYRQLVRLVDRRTEDLRSAIDRLPGGGGRPIVAVHPGEAEGVALLIDLLALAEAGGVALVRNVAQPGRAWTEQVRAAAPDALLQPGGVLRPRSVATRTTDPGRALDPRTYQLVATSGSTGAPALVQLTVTGTLAASAVYLDRLPFLAGRAVAVPQSLATVGALPSGVLPALQVGGTAVLCAGVGLRTFLDALARHDVAFAMAVTGWWEACLRARSWPALPGLAVLGVGGAPWRHVVAPLRDRVPHVDVLGNYGLTETHGPAVQLLVPRQEPTPRHDGVPVGDLSAEVRDGQDGAVAVGRRGVLWLRGPLVAPGYVGPGRVAETDADGWLRTGDVAVMDRAGRVTVVDRADDLVNVAGRKVYPLEVEAVLREVGGWTCAVVPTAGPPRGRRLVAHVVADPTDDGVVSRVRRLVRDELGSHAVPDVLLIDDLPRTASAKVDRGALRARTGPALREGPPIGGGPQAGRAG
jgi:acyl-CoA synthetase (AMP-forming)/AMP-acid ligase II